MSAAEDAVGSGAGKAGSFGERGSENAAGIVAGTRDSGYASRAHPFCHLVDPCAASNRTAIEFFVEDELVTAAPTVAAAQQFQAIPGIRIYDEDTFPDRHFVQRMPKGGRA